MQTDGRGRGCKLKPAAVSFTTDAEKAPKNVTGLEMYKESANSFEFRFDAVLEDGDSYELQYTDKAQLPKRIG